MALQVSRTYLIQSFPFFQLRCKSTLQSTGLEEAEWNSNRPSCLKDNSQRVKRLLWKHPSGSEYEISLWYRLYSEAVLIDHLSSKIKELNELAVKELAQALELRKPPICIAAVKAAMIVQGELPLCSIGKETFTIFAHVSKHPEQEAKEANLALKKSALEYRARSISDKLLFGNHYINYHPNVMYGSPMEYVMEVERRVEDTKALIRAAEKCNFAQQELGYLADWERRYKTMSREFEDYTPPPPLKPCQLPHSIRQRLIKED